MIESRYPYRGSRTVVGDVPFIPLPRAPSYTHYVSLFPRIPDRRSLDKLFSHQRLNFPRQRKEGFALVAEGGISIGRQLIPFVFRIILIRAVRFSSLPSADARTGTKVSEANREADRERTRAERRASARWSVVLGVKTRG